MARYINFQATTKSYATVENAVKAAKKAYPDEAGYNDQTFFIHRDETTGRYFPVFLGERAIQAGIHFNFHVAG